jgi:hypothetical protein
VTITLPVPNYEADQGDRALLVFDASSGQWVASHVARMDFVRLTTDDRIFAIQSDNSAPAIQAQLDLSDLTATRNFRFPNTGGTFALQNQFTVSQAFTNPAVSAPVGVRVDALADCLSGKAIGVGIASTLPVQVEDMLITDENSVRVTVRGIDAGTTVQAIAICLTMP